MDIHPYGKRLNESTYSDRFDYSNKQVILYNKINYKTIINQKNIVNQAYVIKNQEEIINYQNGIIKKKFNALNNINACAICLENIDTISSKKTLECEHSFHKFCINMVKNHKCPLCNYISFKI